MSGFIYLVVENLFAGANMPVRNYKVALLCAVMGELSGSCVMVHLGDPRSPHLFIVTIIDDNVAGNSI